MADAPDHKTDSGLSFYIDSQYQMGRHGSTGWTTSGPWTIYGSGPHTLKWRYSKDSTGSSGSDCAWVDHLQWSGDMPDPNGGEEIAYVYDPAGRRIEKKVDGATQVKYVYDGDNCIAEYDGSDDLLRKYIHGPCIDEPICMIEVADANAVSYYHFDALGSVIALSDGSGNTEQVYEYSVYGQVAASDPNHPNRFMFTGREFDADTGLYYYRARYYNPYIGRFLQTDPVGYEAGMNLYGYCRNNVSSMIDPSGLEPIWSEDGWRRVPEGLFPPIAGAPTIVPGPYFAQHHPMSCVIATTLNLLLTKSQAPVKKVKGGVDFVSCNSDVEAEKWVETQFAEVSRKGNADIGGYGFGHAIEVLGSGWTHAQARLTRGSIIDKVTRGKAVAIGIDLKRSTTNHKWHAIAIVPTPATHPHAEDCPYTVVDPGAGNGWGEFTQDDQGQCTNPDQTMSPLIFTLEGLMEYLKIYEYNDAGARVGFKGDWIYEN